MRRPAMVRALALHALLLASPGLAWAQQGQTFRPGFGWQPGLRIEATETRAGVLREGAVSDSGRISAASYVIRVREHPDGLLVEHTDIRVEREGDFPADMPPIARVSEVVADNLHYWLRLPDLIVTEHGEFVRVADPATFRSRVESSIRTVTEALAGGDEEIASRVDELLATIDDATMESYAMDRWSSLADRWAFTDWEVGQVYGAEIEAPNPLIPGPAIPYDVQAGLTRLSDCEAPSGGLICAVFVMVTRPVAHALGTAARTLADSLGAQLLAGAGEQAPAEYRDGTEPPLTFEELILEARVELMTDPVTLLPLWVEERQKRAGNGLGLGERFQFYAEEIRTTEFTYPPDE